MISDFFGFVEVEPHVVPCVPLDVTSPHHRLSCRIARMLRLKTIVPVCFALLLAACGGGGHLSVGFPGEGETELPEEVELPEGGVPLKLDFPPRSTKQYQLPFRISGGIPPYESSLDGCPDWVTLFPDQAVLAGTAPSQDRGKSFFCTYRVTESDPGFRPARSVSYGLRLMVGSPEATLTFDGAVRPVPDKVPLLVGHFHDQDFPEASDGVEPYTYSFTCAGGSLPSGMGFAPATRRFAGTPEAPFRDSCTYTVTDSSQPAETFSEAVEVEVKSAETQPLALQSEPPQASFIIGEFRPYTLPEATGGVEPYTYTFTCEGGSLPPGIGFSPATRVLAGVADAVFHASCTYTVTDSSQPAATVSRNVVVSTQSLTLPYVRPQSFVIGTFRSVTLPAATGGVAPYTYTFTCASGRRPPGVGFTPATRVLAGDTDAVFDDLCTYTVTDSSQPAETFSQDIVVTSAAPGSLALPDNTPEKIRFVIGDFHSYPLPKATGGVEPYTYSFTCDGGSLPRGVGFAPATPVPENVEPVLAGVADAPFRDSCEYTVTDSAQPATMVSRDIEVTVESLALLDTPEEVRLVIDNRRSFTLPAATGGVAPYTCAVHVHLHLRRRVAALRHGLRTRNPQVRRHAGCALPRFVRIHGHGQRAIPREGPAGHRGDGRVPRPA